MKEGHFLSTNAIANIFKFKWSKSNTSDIFLVDYNLQISQIIYYSAMNDNIYTLCDLTHHYPNFIIVQKLNSIVPKENDIIKVNSISSYFDNQHQCRVFIINSYDLIGHSPFGVLPYTHQFDPNEVPNAKVYFRNEPFAEYCNLIKHLSSLNTNVTLYIKVMTKTPLIPYRNKSGMFFFFDAIDKEKSQLRIVAFNSNAQFFFSMIKINSFYQIRGNFAKQKGSFKVDDNQLEEIYLSNESEIIEINNKANALLSQDPSINEFHTIHYVLSASPFVLVNIIGKVMKVYKVSCSKSSKGTVFGVKQLTIRDLSGCEIEVQLWNHYTLYPIKQNDIVALYNIQIKQNKSKKILSVFNDTKVVVNPKIKEAIALSNCEGDLKGKFSGIDNWLDIKLSEILYSKNKDKASNGRKRIKGVIVSIKHSDNNYYEGCVDLSCKEKVTKIEAMWKCFKCNRRSITFNYYYTLHAEIKDCSGSAEVILVNTSGFNLLGINAFQYKELYETGKEYILELLSEIIKYKQFYFYCNIASTLPLEIEKIEEVNARQESKELIQQVKAHFFNKSYNF